MVPVGIALLIPIFVVLGGVALAIVAVIFQAKRKYLEHLERIKAIEKGIEPPSNIVKELQKREPMTPERLRRHGLIWLFIGVGYIVMMLLLPEQAYYGAPVGAIPVFVGLGLLIAAAVDFRAKRQA